MKVIAINGSPREGGNTHILVSCVLDELQKEGIETDIIRIGGELVRGCTACNECWKNKNRRCVIDDDIINSCIEKMVLADGIIIGSPTYFANVTTEIKALIDRAGAIGCANGNMFRRKVGAAVVSASREGALNVYNAITDFFLIEEMVVPGSCYWNTGIGFDKGEVSEDSDGLHTMQVLGQNMAWLLKKLHI
ncbi:flavodoxin family protein [Chlorobium ferrooxidans]|uniref:NADPH-dependent FMN reductase n=1 Tax=Chlorobium ferrooxidans DSM 13031 TaxID=377431 RepID=Q0YPD3_9CHLB|nr:flavodoxin family protein [Chlorobium ferrooxidans]EAT58157.1 NADPH-dependent FMN reductase [Chlorobium ferrooxidans DSM 13031]